MKFDNYKGDLTSLETKEGILGKIKPISVEAIQDWDRIIELRFIDVVHIDRQGNLRTTLINEWSPIKVIEVRRSRTNPFSKEQCVVAETESKVEAYAYNDDRYVKVWVDCVRDGMRTTMVYLPWESDSKGERYVRNLYVLDDSVLWDI